MPPSHRYDRLSAQDNSFLVSETQTAHMHIGGVSVFELGDLATHDGGVDFASLNVNFDLFPWHRGFKVLATYRRWLAEHEEPGSDASHPEPEVTESALSEAATLDAVDQAG